MIRSTADFLLDLGATGVFPLGITIEVESEDQVIDIYKAYHDEFMAMQTLPVNATNDGPRDLMVCGVPVTLKVKE